MALVSGQVSAGANGYNAGETITQGMSVYLSAANKWMKAKCGGTAIEAGIGAAALGIALNSVLNGQPLAVLTGGNITIGATVVVATLYVISATYGGIAPITDLVSTNHQTILGVANTATTLDLTIKYATGLVLP